MNSTFMSLDIKDLSKGLLMAVLSSVLTIVYNTVEAGSLDFNWQAIGMAAITSGIAYLMKNLLSNSNGKFLGSEK
jgi:hypothetical protein